MLDRAPVTGAAPAISLQRCLLAACAAALLASVAGGQPHAYFTNVTGSSVTVVDTSSLEVVTVVAAGHQPRPGEISPDGRRFYFANYSDDTLSVIDTANNTILATLDVGDRPRGVAVLPDGRKVYVTAEEENAVYVLDAETLQITTTIPVDEAPRSIETNLDGSRVFATNARTATLTVIDSATDTVLDSFVIGGPCFEPPPEGVDPCDLPRGLAIAPDGATAYVANQEFYSPPGTVSVVDLASGEVRALIAVGVNPFTAVLGPDASRLYVSNRGSNSVSVIDLASLAVVAEIPVGSQPTGMSVHPDGRTLWVANQASDDASIIDLATETVLATVPAGDGPVGAGNFIQPMPPTGLTLEISGECPGSPLFTLGGAPPSADLAVVRSPLPGEVSFSAGPCAGLASGLATLNLLLEAPAGESGGFTATVALGSVLCTHFFQAVDLTHCTLSPVATPAPAPPQVLAPLALER